MPTTVTAGGSGLWTGRAGSRFSPRRTRRAGIGRAGCGEGCRGEMANGRVADGKFGESVGDWMRGRGVVVVCGENRAAWESKKEGEKLWDRTRGWNEDVLLAWQQSLRPWPGGDGERRLTAARLNGVLFVADFSAECERARWRLRNGGAECERRGRVVSGHGAGAWPPD